MYKDTLEQLLKIVKTGYKKQGIGPALTGEKNLVLNAEELTGKLKISPKHVIYTKIMSKHGVGLTTNKVMLLDKVDDKLIVTIPDWDQFVIALDILSKLL